MSSITISMKAVIGPRLFTRTKDRQRRIRQAHASDVVRISPTRHTIRLRTNQAVQITKGHTLDRRVVLARHHTNTVDTHQDLGELDTRSRTFLALQHP